MHVLFGGGGFIGRHLCDHLETLGLPFSIVTLKPNLRLFKLYKSLKEIHRASELDEDVLRSIVPPGSTVFYMAGSSKPASFLSYPWHAVREEVEPAFAMMAMFARLKEVQVIYISSAGAIYGNTNTRCDETMPTLPISAYGLSKLHIENAIGFLERSRGLNCKILRVTNPVGQHQSADNHGLISVSLRKVLLGEPITVYGNMKSSRDYIDADDLAEAMLCAASRRDMPGGIWNLGQGGSHSIREVLEIIEEVTKRKPEIVKIPSRSFDVDIVRISTDKFQTDYDWQPKTEIRETVHKLMTHYEQDFRA